MLLYIRIQSYALIQLLQIFSFTVEGNFTYSFLTQLIKFLLHGVVAMREFFDGDFLGNRRQGVVDDLDRDGVDAVGFAVTLHGGLPRAR